MHDACAKAGKSPGEAERGVVRFEVCGQAAVRGARERVRGVVEAWGFDAALDDLVVCVSEAVTNALVHAGRRPVSVRVTCTRTGVRVEVADGAPRRPRVLVPAEVISETPDIAVLEERGRGLFLLGVLASRWGVAAEPPSGKRVWFELDVPVHVSAHVPVAVGAAR